MIKILPIIQITIIITTIRIPITIIMTMTITITTAPANLDNHHPFQKLMLVDNRPQKAFYREEYNISQH